MVLKVKILIFVIIELLNLVFWSITEYYIHQFNYNNSFSNIWIRSGLSFNFVAEIFTKNMRQCIITCKDECKMMKLCLIILAYSEKPPSLWFVIQVYNKLFISALVDHALLQNLELQSSTDYSNIFWFYFISSQHTLINWNSYILQQIKLLHLIF